MIKQIILDINWLSIFKHFFCKLCIWALQLPHSHYSLTLQLFLPLIPPSQIRDLFNYCYYMHIHIHIHTCVNNQVGLFSVAPGELTFRDTYNLEMPEARDKTRIAATMKQKYSDSVRCIMCVVASPLQFRRPLNPQV